MSSREFLIITDLCGTFLGRATSAHLLDCLRLVHHHSLLLVIALCQVLFEQTVFLSHRLP